MPDQFQDIPDGERSDIAPAGHPVPSSGISDSPAYIAIINELWLEVILGAIDRLGYANVWRDSDDQLFAFHQINNLQAQIMTSPYNNITGGKRVDVRQFNQTFNATGQAIIDVLDTDGVSTYMLTAISAQIISGALSRLIVAPGPLNNTSRRVIDEINPTINMLYKRDGLFFLKPNQFLYLNVIVQTQPCQVIGSVHYVVLEE
jgi:hypothetical protein